jgi:branched-subunit amino acid aminotransferase/4-amino-4-deoxychorismate lyase
VSDSADKIELNGEPVQIADLRALVQTNYGHFTAMRVEDGGVRGLDLHLARLDASTQALYGAPLGAERVRAYLRHIVAGARTLSLRVNVFARDLDRDRLDRVVAPDVLVMASASRPAIAAPMRVKSFVYARAAANIKHVGTFSLFHHRRLAQLEGFDDALFADASGRVSEGSIWNVGFVDADGQVVWPDAPQLDGISMQLLKMGLARNGVGTSTRLVRLADLANHRAAFFTNASVPVRPIASIDAHRFDGAVGAWVATLQRCYESNEPQAI